MANISAIKLPSGNTYDLVDKTSGYVTTDEKLVVNQENSNNTYYPIISTSSTAASTKYIDTRGIKLDITNGTERSQGDITLVLGNSTAVNYDGNKAGLLQLYGPYSRYVQIQTPSSFTSDVYLTLPSSTGTLALTSNIKDATLTIQKNGVNVETFSANASSNKTANIVVNEVPSGGTTGQVLAKNSATDYDVSWADVSGAYIVTFTYDNQNETWSCDKTAQEIYEACESGKIAIGICDNSVFPCKYFSDDGEEDNIHYYSATFTSSMYYGYSNTLIADEFYVGYSEVERNTYFVDPVSRSRKINNKSLSADITLTASDVGAQEPLVSGTNIKTINNNSILGSGNIDIQDGGAFIATFTYDDQNETWSCDKTAQQIYEAYQANKSIIAVSTYSDDVGIIFYLDTIRRYYVEEEEHIYIRFIPQQHTDGGSNATIHNLTLELYQDGWVERTYNEVEAVTNTYGVSGSSYIITDDGERGGQIRATNDNSGASATIYWSAMDGDSYDESSIVFSAEHIKTNQVSPTEDYDVATKEYVDSSVSGISVPTKTSDLTNDSGFISTETDPTVPSWAKQSTKPTYTASEVGALPDTTTIPSKTSDLTNDSGFITGMTILSYGSSTWQNFIDAYNASKVVYCRASSSANPASGSQTRLAFMAYVNNATTPTEVEFQYYRSVSTHTASQQGDQVYVYKLNKTNGWSVTTREASVKVVAGTGLSGTYSNGTMTLTAPHDTTKQDTLVSGTNIKTINNESLLGSGNITVSAEAGIFVCEYGVTTSADALVAYNAGKRLVCHYNNSLLDFYAWLEAYDSENTYFEFEVTSGDKHMEFYLDSNGWTRDEYSASAIPIARRISKFNSDARINSMDMTSSEIEDFVEDLDMGASGLLNMFYPVGSYYETSDSTFDPNVRWGGTWVQDTQIYEKKTNLYNGTFTSGSATLNESVENFFKLEITYATNDGDISTLEVVNNYSNSFVVSIDKTRIISGWYAKAIYVSFSTTTMSSGNNKQAYFSAVSANGTYISIKRVDGYVQTAGYMWHRTT